MRSVIRKEKKKIKRKKKQQRRGGKKRSKAEKRRLADDKATRKQGEGREGLKVIRGMRRESRRVVETGKGGGVTEFRG